MTAADHPVHLVRVPGHVAPPHLRGRTLAAFLAGCVLAGGSVGVLVARKVWLLFNGDARD